MGRTWWLIYWWAMLSLKDMSRNQNYIKKLWSPFLLFLSPEVSKSQWQRRGRMCKPREIESAAEIFVIRWPKWEKRARWEPNLILTSKAKQEPCWVINLSQNHWIGNHRIFRAGWDLLTSSSPTPAMTGSPTPGDPGIYPGGFWMIPERETPQSSWAASWVLCHPQCKENFPYV